jgi:preprotein translocase subunit YajC
MQLLLPLLLLVFMYLLLIRPQQQRVRRQRALVTSLEVGDRIVTIGGVVGDIVALREDSADIEVADGIVITFLRPAINRKYEPAPEPGPAGESGLADEPHESHETPEPHETPDGPDGRG